MTVMEFLKNNVSSLDCNNAIELRDIVDEGIVRCKDYNTMVEELSVNGLEHVKNARFVAQKEENRNILFYMKDTQEYSDFDLVQLTEKLYGRTL